MKTIYLLFLTAIVFSVSATAQITPLDETVLECEYSLTMQQDTLHKSQPVTDDMVLRIGKNVSQFFSRYTFYHDSLWAEDFEKAADLSIKSLNSGNLTEGPHIRTFRDYIYKNHPEGKLTTMRKELIVGFIYEEDYKSQQWTVLDDSVKQILGYPCRLARCDFRNRTFFAWFTKDIPYDNGPWKLNGLPGLIMEAYDKNKDYHYMITSLKTDNLMPVTLYNYDQESYIKTTRKEFLDAQMEFVRGTQRDKIKLINNVQWKGKKQNYMDRGPRRILYDFLERDYK